MKTKEEILNEITTREDVSIDECYTAMIEAQVVVIKEMVKRKWIDSPMTDHYKSIDEIATELIKEIEG